MGGATTGSGPLVSNAERGGEEVGARETPIGPRMSGPCFPRPRTEPCPLVVANGDTGKEGHRASVVGQRDTTQRRSTAADPHRRTHKGGEETGREKKMVGDPYLRRSSAEVRLGRCWRPSGADATVTPGEAVTGLRRDAVVGPSGSELWLGTGGSPGGARARAGESG